MCGWEFVPHTHTIHHEKERQRPNEGHTVFSNDQFAHVKKALKIKESKKLEIEYHQTTIFELHQNYGRH